MRSMLLRRDASAAMGTCTRSESTAGTTFDGREMLGLTLIAGATLTLLLILRALIRRLSETPEDT